MPIEYTPHMRQIQDKFGTRKMADRIAEFAPPILPSPFQFTMVMDYS